MTPTQPPSALPPPPPPPLATARRWKPTALLIGAGVLGCALISGTIAGVDEVAGRIDAEEADSQDDATIRECGEEATGPMAAIVTVTNDSSGSSTYVIEVEFVRDGRAVDRDEVIVSELAAGATVESNALAEVAFAADTECRIAHVDRFSD